MPDILCQPGKQNENSSYVETKENPSTLNKYCVIEISPRSYKTNIYHKILFIKNNPIVLFITFQHTSCQGLKHWKISRRLISKCCQHWPCYRRRYIQIGNISPMSAKANAKGLLLFTQINHRAKNIIFISFPLES